MFIKIFFVEALAKTFASERGVDYSIRYDWDDFRQEIIKEFVVHY